VVLRLCDSDSPNVRVRPSVTRPPPAQGPKKTCAPLRPLSNPQSPAATAAIICTITTAFPTEAWTEAWAEAWASKSCPLSAVGATVWSNLTATKFNVPLAHDDLTTSPTNALTRLQTLTSRVLRQCAPRLLSLMTTHLTRLSRGLY